MLNCPRCELESDYIPKGESITFPTDIKEIKEWPTFGFQRCGVSVGDDIQSGPIYCGGRATLMCIDEKSGHPAFVCKRHERVLQNMVDDRKWKEKREAEESDKRMAEAELWDGA